MAKRKWIQLTASELRIWEAAYASAFADLFLAHYRSRRAQDPDRAGHFEAAMSADHWDAASDIADASVVQLREWRRPRAPDGAPDRIDVNKVYPPVPKPRKKK